MQVTYTPGLCQCGCGAPTRPTARTDSRRGVVKGQPTRFLPGHQFKKTFDEQFRYEAAGDGCWLWAGCRDRYGYGHIRLNGRSVLAHRAAYEHFVDAIPMGLHVLHRCDTPACVNPDHLFLGTHVDNMADMSSKGRAKAGGWVRWIKLSPQLHEEIRRRYTGAHGEQVALAREYGVAPQTISRIVNDAKGGPHVTHDPAESALRDPAPASLIPSG